MKRHLKRLAIPNTWKLAKKADKFTIKPYPSGYPSDLGIPMGIILRDILCLANNTKEAKYILNNKTVNVNYARVKDVKHDLCLFDVLEIKDTKKFYRMILNKNGKILPVEIDAKEAEIKPLKITGKKTVKKGRVQLNFFGGFNLITDNKEYNVDDTLVLDLAKKEIKNHLKFEKKKTVFLFDGSNAGETGVVEDINRDKIILKSSSRTFETLKKYAYVIGDEKPMIELEK